MTKKKLLSLLVLTALSAAVHAATPPSTPGRCPWSPDDIVSLDPAEANELSSIQMVPSLYQRLVQPDRDNLKITPILAASWQADLAAKTLTIAEARCQICLGNPLRPEDIIFSYTRAVTLNKSPRLSSTSSAGSRTTSPAS